MGNKADKKAARAAKQTQQTDTTQATAIQPAGDEAPAAQSNEPTTETVATATVKTPRVKKNATEVGIDFNDPDSAMQWFESFTRQCESHPPRKGYDQHWNSDGFIHTGPATRLPNQGATRMLVFLGHTIAKRAIAGDKEAAEALQFSINFISSISETLQAKQNEAILAQADAIRARQAQPA